MRKPEFIAYLNFLFCVTASQPSSGGCVSQYSGRRKSYDIWVWG
jgi:hypothetical protein